MKRVLEWTAEVLVLVPAWHSLPVKPSKSQPVCDSVSLPVIQEVYMSAAVATHTTVKNFLITFPSRISS